MDARMRSAGDLDAIRRKWAPYDKCPDCDAIAGNPCRNVNRSGWPGGSNVRNKPHPTRPLKATP